MSVSLKCCVCLGRGLCDRLKNRPIGASRKGGGETVGLFPL